MITPVQAKNDHAQASHAVHGAQESKASTQASAGNQGKQSVTNVGKPQAPTSNPVDRPLLTDPALAGSFVPGIPIALRVVAAEAYATVLQRLVDRFGPDNSAGYESQLSPVELSESATPPQEPSVETRSEGPNGPSKAQGSGVNAHSGGIGASATTGSSSTSLQPEAFSSSVSDALGYRTLQSLQSVLQTQPTNGATAPTLEGTNYQSISAMNSTWQWSHDKSSLSTNGNILVSRDFSSIDSAGRQTTVSAAQTVDTFGRVLAYNARIYTELGDGKGLAISYADNLPDSGAGTLSVQFFNFGGQCQPFTIELAGASDITSLSDLLIQRGIDRGVAGNFTAAFLEAVRLVYPAKS